MKGFFDVARAVAWRNLLITYKSPALVVPSIIFPLVFLIAFAGGLSSVGNVPGFDYGPGYTAFQYCFVFLQSAAFGGVFTGFGAAVDFELQFARRLFVAAPHREGVLAGYVVAALGRYVVTCTVVTIAALLAGMQVDGGAVDLFGLVLLGFMVNIVAALFGVGVALRAQTIQAGPMMQMPVFLVLFLAPVYVPLELLTGWIDTLAHLNPATALLEAARGFVAGAPAHPGLAFACGAGSIVLLLVFGLRGLRQAEAGE